MPHCPLCGSTHVVVTLRPARRAYCVGCDLEWGIDGPSPEAEEFGMAPGQPTEPDSQPSQRVGAWG
ncbi:MAG TPA: hypothetical protein VHA57_07080 [Actinomycetota bacterium]|nr:hypothetical protein [Actinomycetota bacterium]